VNITESIPVDITRIITEDKSGNREKLKTDLSLCKPWRRKEN